MRPSATLPATTSSPDTRRGRRARAALIGVLGVSCVAALAAPAVAKGTPKRVLESRAAAAYNRTNLALAAQALEQQAISVGAMHHKVFPRQPAKAVMAAVTALTSAARKHDPSLRPTDTRAVMGKIPVTVLSRSTHHAPHHHISATHTLLRFSHAIADYGSSGIGLHRKHAGNQAALLRKPDGLYVQPHVQLVRHATVGEVAVRWALKELGQPYVWAGGGPTVFDCSGLTQWAYAHAGVGLAHFTGDQWNEGRLIAGKDMLPGDLILFGHPIVHVGMYLGAGWMINAPYTGQYVDVVPVGEQVNGIIRP